MINKLKELLLISADGLTVALYYRSDPDKPQTLILTDVDEVGVATRGEKNKRFIPWTSIDDILVQL